MKRTKNVWLFKKATDQFFPVVLCSFFAVQVGSSRDEI